MNRDCDAKCAPGLCPEYPCPDLLGDPPAFYVYVANRLSGDPGEYLANVAEISLVSRRLIDAGFCPINPAGDLIEGLVSCEPLPVVAYQRRSLELLRLLALLVPVKRCALLLVNGERRDGSVSAGVQREIEEAEALGIPIVAYYEALCELRREAV